MTIKINGTNTIASPSITGPDTDTGLVYGTDEVSIVTGGTERVKVDSSGRLLVGTSSSRAAAGVQWDSQIESTGNTGLSIISNTNNASTSYLILGKSRGSSVGSNTIVSDSDPLGIIFFNGADGTDLGSAGASIRADVDGTPGANDMPGRIVLSTSADGASSPTERMRIDSSGNVGIGTTSVDELLHLQGASADDTTLKIESTNTAAERSAIEFFNASVSRGRVSGSNDFDGLTLDSSTTETSAVIRFRTGGASLTERMRIKNNGDILFNTTTFNGTDNSISFSGLGYQYLRRTSGPAQTMMAFFNGSSVVGEIRSSTTATQYITNSDYRLKENIVPVAGGITRLKQLKPSCFNFIADPSKTVDGFIAHEAQAVVPECATGAKDDVDADGNPVYQGIDQSKLVPLLTAALQEAIAKIETLETKVAALEAAE